MPDKTRGMDFISGWIPLISGLVPPFCVELVLVDGSHYFLRSMCLVDEETGSAVIQVWDFRALGDADIEALKLRLNEVSVREHLSPAEELHPRLDWANLRIRLDRIAYCVEWHDRLWPEEQRPHQKKIGFRTGDES